jgi:ADP-ribosylglycohydrolase
LGQCLGDALGFPVEGSPSHVCLDYLRENLDSRERSHSIRGREPFPSDARCSAGAIAIAGAVALAVRSTRVDLEEWARSLSQWMACMNAEFAGLVLRLPEWVSLDPDDAAALISRCGLSSDYAGGDWQGISPFVVPSVLWSLYSFLRTPNDYLETIRTAIAVGGDVDTTAAMAGAISGAHLGMNGLPRKLAECVTDRGTWGFLDLVHLAHHCHGIFHEREDAGK